MDAEVEVSGRFNAEVAVGIQDPVEVTLQDFILGVLLLDGNGELDLAHFFANPFVGAEFDFVIFTVGCICLNDDVIHVLLGDGGCALSGTALNHGGNRTQQPTSVNAAVLVVAGVFHRNDGVAHGFRDVFQRHFSAVLVIERGQHGAIGGKNSRGLSRRPNGHLIRKLIKEGDR